MTSAPLWLCFWWREGRESKTRWIQALNKEAVRRQCQRKGWGDPDRIKRAGYAGEPGAKRSQSKLIAKRKAARSQVGRKRAYPRARAALELYRDIRQDWPTRTLAGENRKVSDGALRDFAANVGLAMEMLAASHLKALERWLYASNEYDAQRVYRHKVCQEAMAIMDEALAGEHLEGLRAALAFAFLMIDRGMEPEDALQLADRWRRVAVPRV